MSLFAEIFEHLPRQGPGSAADTRRALAAVRDELPPEPRILDLGCGSGVSTLLLAAETRGQVTAVDRSQALLDRLALRAVYEGVEDHVVPCRQDMATLDLPDERYDLVWSEGAIYCMGFDAGLALCNRMLRPGGFLVLSECSWLTGDPPEDAIRYWRVEYPDMCSRTENIESVERAGFQIVDTFTISETAWWADYLGPLSERIEMLRGVYANDERALTTLQAVSAEVTFHRRNLGTYGYVFYIGRKPAISS